MSTKLTLEERETHFNISADNRSRTIITTDDQVWIDRLLQWFTPTEIKNETTYFFNVPTSLVIRETALLNGTNKLKTYSRSKRFYKTT